MNTQWTLEPEQFESLNNHSVSVIGNMQNRRSRSLFNYFGQSRRACTERVCLCSGSVKLLVGDGITHDPRPELMPVCVKPTVLLTSGDAIKAQLPDSETWQFNSVLAAHLNDRGINVPEGIGANPERATHWLKSTLRHGASEIDGAAYIDLVDCEEVVNEQAPYFESPDFALAG